MTRRPISRPRPWQDAAPIPTGHTLAVWAGWFMEATCGCKQVWLPLNMLVEQHGADRLLPDVARRLRCQACGEHPATALVDSLQISGGGVLVRAARRVAVPEG